MNTSVEQRLAEAAELLEAQNGRIDELVAERDQARARITDLEGTIEGLRRGNADARRMVDAVLRLLDQKILNRRQEARINELQAELTSAKEKLEELAREGAAVEEVLNAITEREEGPPGESPTISDSGEKPKE